MDPARYLKEIVRPTLEEFERDPTSVRRAFIACVVTFHTLDYLGGSRQKFGQACPEFATVDRVAHAFKHVETGHPNNTLKPPLKALEIVSRPPAVAGLMACGLSRVGDAIGGVTIWTDTTVDLTHVLRRAYAFLSAKVETEGWDGSSLQRIEQANS